MNPAFTTAVAQAHRQDLIRAARQARLAAEVPGRTGLAHRLLSRMSAYVNRTADVNVVTARVA